MEEKINILKAAAFYYVSHIFAQSSLYKISLRFIERCFPMFVDSETFLQLGFISVSRILSSSKLHVDSELQVFNAADRWLYDNITERSKHTKRLLLRIRLSLLSVSALNFILNKNSCFKRCNECVGIIKEALKNKNSFNSNNPSINSRFCDQDNFNIIYCGGNDVNTQTVVSDVHSVKANSLNTGKIQPSMKEERQFSKIVCLKGDVYVFGGVDSKNNTVMSIEKYSAAFKSWETIGSMYDNRRMFCVCSFMDNIYVLGGIKDYLIQETCIEFNTNTWKWKEVAGMNEERCNNESGIVFQERIVISGGKHPFQYFNTVEAYDPLADKWSYMPNMVEERSYHKSVSIKNKLFVVGGYRKTCEVFDSVFNKFVLLVPPLASFKNFLHFPAEVISISNKVFVFGYLRKTFLVYDVKNNKWS